MPKEMKVGCARPTGGPVGGDSSEEKAQAQTVHEEVKHMIQVGKKAPDFIAPAYYKGQFVNVELSEYLGKVGPPLLLPR